MKMNTFHASSMCLRRRACAQCRKSRPFREYIAKRFKLDEVDFGCPFGMTIQNVEMPPLKQEVKNLMGTLADVGKHAAKGGKVMADKATQAERLAICGECEFFRPDKQRCAKCGCKMTAKVTLAAARCPLKKW